MASFFRRIEQSVLQGIGAVTSSYEKDSSYAKDEERLEKLDQAARELSSSLGSFLASQRQERDAAFKYASTVEKVCGAAPSLQIPSSSSSSAPIVMDLKALTRLQHALRTSVGAAGDKHLSEGQGRIGLLLKHIAALKTDFAVRKEKVFDCDSYVRRVQQAEQAARTADSSTIAQTREDLKRLQGKAKDMNNIVANATESIRARLKELEEEVRSAALEGSLAFLAVQSYTHSHAADAASALLPQFPGTSLHLGLLSEQCYQAAGVANIAAHTLGRSQDPQLNLAPSLVDAMRLPVGAFVGAGNFSALHNSSAAPKAARSGPGGIQKGAGIDRLPTGKEVSEQAGVLRPPHAGGSLAPTKKLDVASIASKEKGLEPLILESSGGGYGGDDSDGEDEGRPTLPLTSNTQQSLIGSTAINSSSSSSSSSSFSTTTTSTSSITSKAIAGVVLSDLFIGAFEFTPESGDEIPLSVGGVIRVLKRSDDGWWLGRDCTTGAEGVFPFNRTRQLTNAEASKYVQINSAPVKAVVNAAVSQSNVASNKNIASTSTTPAPIKAASQPQPPITPGTFDLSPMPSKTTSTSTTFTGTAIVDPFDLGGAPTGTSQLGGSEFDVFS
jgi:hypothetical protein